MMGPSIVYLTRTEYDALEVKIERNLYICTDTHEAFKGEQFIQDVIVYAQVKPENPSTNKIYCIAKNLFLWDGEEWIDITQIIIDQVEIALDPAKHVTKDQLRDAMEQVEDDVPTISFDDLYARLKEAGYKGSKATFVAQLAEVLNATEDIVVNEESNVPVIEVDGQSYTSASEAFAAVAPNSEVVFLRNSVLDSDVTLQEGVTLDFNNKLVELDNKSITVSGGNTVIKNASIVDNADVPRPADVEWSIKVANGATLTMQNVSIDTRSDQVLNVAGSVVLEDVDITSSLDPDYAAGAYDSKSLIFCSNPGSITIKSGSIIADTSNDLECGLYAIYAASGAEVVLGDQATGEGPTIITNSAPIGTNNTDGGTNNITIYGGTYKSLMTHPGFMGVMYLGAAANVTISGGKFDGGDYDLALPYKDPQYIVNISGGEFDGGVVIKKDFKQGGSGSGEPDQISIVGGIYLNIVPDEFIAEGFGCAKRADGMYEVVAINTPGAVFVGPGGGEGIEETDEEF